MMDFHGVTEKELEFFDFWRKSYAYFDSNKLPEDFAPSKFVLKEWWDAKSEYLMDLMGGELILSRNVEFEDIEGISEELDDWLAKQTRGTFLGDLSDAIVSHYNLSSYPYIESSKIINMIWNRDNYVSNKVPFNIVIHTPKEDIKVQSGAKLLKIFSKLATAYEIEGFEPFRVAHSRILNKLKIKAELCLSIHPLDYVTMSDNDCKWSSCMSWSNYGCYRQGTVEMMNSPCVVIAYLKSKTSMKIWNFEWNNKKWRSLYIVTPKMISNIKGYPYQLEVIDKMVINWLKGLAEKNCHWEYKSSMFSLAYDENMGISVLRNTVLGTISDIKFRISTNMMYNDYGLVNEYIYFAKDIENMCYDRSYYNYDFDIYTSGLSQCMVCGKTHVKDGVEISETVNLSCEDCEPSMWCHECGDRITESSFHTDVHGNHYCDNCFNSFFIRPFQKEDYYFKGTDTIELIVVDSMIFDTFNNEEVERYHDKCNLRFYYPTMHFIGKDDMNSIVVNENQIHLINVREYGHNRTYYTVINNIKPEYLNLDVKDYYWVEGMPEFELSVEAMNAPSMYYKNFSDMQNTAFYNPQVIGNLYKKLGYYIMSISEEYKGLVIEIGQTLQRYFDKSPNFWGSSKPDFSFEF